MDDVLPIVLSFLPAHEAVRTCVLFPGWRHVWTSAPGLRITAVGGFGSANKFIFQRDLKWRPTFPMLKTLILDDWCLHADLSAVIHFIQHSPNLEKVTLKFVEEFDSSMVTEGDNNLLEGTFSSDHLKMVEIKCLKVDGRINKILKILSACGISLEKIYIRQANTSSDLDVSVMLVMF